MWLYRRILCIPWTALQTNEKVLQKMDKNANCFVVSNSDSSNFNAIRRGKLEDLALSGRIPGKRARGAHCFTFINNFKHLYQILDNYRMLPETEQIGKAS